MHQFVHATFKSAQPAALASLFWKVGYFSWILGYYGKLVSVRVKAWACRPSEGSLSGATGPARNGTIKMTRRGSIIDTDWSDYLQSILSDLTCNYRKKNHIPDDSTAEDFMEYFFGLLVLIVIIFVMMGVTVVQQGFVYTIERFGRYTYSAQPGLTVIIPFFDRVGRKVNVMEQVLDIPGQEIITKDNAMVGVDAVVFFQVLDAAKAAYEVSDLYNAIMQITTTNLRTVMGSMDLDETLSKRDDINGRLLSVVDHATSPWGVKITRVEVKDIRPPADISNAMARQMKAEREKRAQILEAEGMRAAEILRAEGEKQSQILQAEGRKEAAFRDAEAREREAEAEAKATVMVSDSIATSGTQALNYFIAQKYTEAISQFATSPNAKTILFPVEATQLIGTLGGIGELAKAALTPTDK